MKLKFSSTHLSINSFNDVELPDFTIITGLNGSGKSHLLSAIEKKSIQIDDLLHPRIVLFNYINFMLDQESQFSGINLSQEKESAWQYYNNQGFNTNFVNWEKSNINEENYELLKDISKSHNKSIWNLTETEIVNQEVYSQLLKYKTTVNDYIYKNQQFKSNPQAFSILKLIGSLNYGVRELTQDGFLKEYIQIPFKNDFLPQMIGKVFLDYAIRYDINRYNFLMAKHESNFLNDELAFIDPLDYEQQYPKPWNILNEILGTYNNFDYIFTNPEKVIVKNRNANWQVELQSNLKPDLKVTFGNLSSGEKILLALAISMFKSSSDKFFPDILLLDEIDASLHPSMIRNLFKVIEEVFLKHNVKVILVTHSPTTIALANEESIFLMNKYGDNRLEKATKSNALSVLTEGFVSLTEDNSVVGISYGIESSQQNTILLTEGITDKIILETAWKTLYPEKSQPFYIQDCFDAGFLGNLLSRGHEPSGIFKVYSNKQFIAIFDFDNKGYSQWNNSKKDYSDILLDPMNCLGKKHTTYNCYKLLLPVPQIDNIKNQVINPSDGSHFGDQSYLTIEMLFYDVDILNTYFTEQSAPFGGKKIEFCCDKVSFANKIKALSKNDFKHFCPLFENILNLQTNK